MIIGWSPNPIQVCSGRGVSFGSPCMKQIFINSFVFRFSWMTYEVHCLMESSCHNWFTILPKNRSMGAYVNREYPNKGFKAPDPLIYREGNIASKTAGNREHCLKNSREQGTLGPPYPSPKDPRTGYVTIAEKVHTR